jgi:cysteine desulfuration protein SufE
VASTDIRALLEPFNLTRELSSNRTQGVPNMIALVHETAARLAAA